MKWLNRYLLNIVLSMMVLLVVMLGIQTANAGGYSGEANILEVYVFNGGFYAQLDPNVAVDPNSCSSFGGYFIFPSNQVDPNQKSYKEFLGTILTAYTLGNKVNIYVNSCYSNGYPLGEVVRMIK